MTEEKNSANENRQAELLARWLDAPETEGWDGGPSAELSGEPGLDPELLGVVYTLSPKRAPAPRLDLDALIAGVKSGPFAAPPEPARPEPVQPRPDPRRVALSAPRPVPTAPRPLVPRRFLPAVGLAAAAALAAVLVIPVATMYGVTEPNPDVLHAPMPEMASATPPPPAQPQRAVVAEAVPPGERPAASPAPLAASPAVGQAPPAASGPAAAMPAPAPIPATPGAARRDPVAVTVAATEMKTDADNNAQGDVSAYGAPATGGATAERENDEAPEDAKEKQELARLEEERAEGGAEMDDLSIAESVAAKSAPKSAARSGRSAPAAQGASPSMEAPIAQTAPDGGGGSVWPLDYAEGWYTRYPDVAPAYQAALALEAARSWPAAAAAWQRLMSDERNNVAQDAAFRAARAWWQAGQSGTALALIEDGLRRSTANTAFRARLYALKADLLASQGKTREAESARQQAIVLNAAR